MRLFLLTGHHSSVSRLLYLIAKSTRGYYMHPPEQTQTKNVSCTKRYEVLTSSVFSRLEILEFLPCFQGSTTFCFTTL